MASKIAKKAGLKVFANHLEQYAPKDPYYEEHHDEVTGQKTRRRRDIPPGLSTRDARILKSVNRRAHYLDKGFKLCGFQFGWTFIISFIPVVGDITDAALNYTLVVRKCKQAELPDWLVRKMLANNAVSLAVSFIPIVGDIILGIWKANSRNAALLEEFLRIRGEEYMRGEGHRHEDPKVIKPGAGKLPNEVVPKTGEEAVVAVANPSAPKKSSWWRPTPPTTSGYADPPKSSSHPKAASSASAAAAPVAGSSKLKK